MNFILTHWFICTWFPLAFLAWISMLIDQKHLKIEDFAFMLIFLAFGWISFVFAICYLFDKYHNVTLIGRRDPEPSKPKGEEHKDENDEDRRLDPAL